MLLDKYIGHFQIFDTKRKVLMDDHCKSESVLSVNLKKVVLSEVPVEYLFLKDRGGKMSYSRE